MSREVRITIDDDEVFERMKRRKQTLDLSWEDVLHRGLRREGRDGAASQDRYDGGGGREDRRPPSAPDDADRRRSDRGRGTAGGAGWRDRASSTPRHGGDQYEDQWDRFADSVEAQVQNKVYNALRDTFGVAGIDVPAAPDSPMDREMHDLSRAEDAVLSFDFLADDPAYQVPLRVTLETSVDGLEVEVVAVRHGKNVRDMNRFDSDARLTVTKRLANGAPAVLRFDDGAEGYAVEPVIRWERDDAGRPTVTAVAIEGVRLDDDDVE